MGFHAANHIGALEAWQEGMPFHRDPADQIVVATARVLGLTLITRDERLLAFRHVRTVAG